MEYRCVQCGFRVKTLFVQYSPGNIRLMKCENCKAVADEYIECELMIVLIDLILHKPKAYRHVLYNVLNQQSTHFQGLLWKSLFGFLVLDAYRSLLVKRPEEEWGMSMSISSFFWIYRKMLVDVILGNFMFLCSFLLAIRNLLKTSAQFSSFRDLLLAVLISSYFKIFLAAMMVWEFPPSVIYIIDLFVLSSNTVALKVFTVFIAVIVVSQLLYVNCMSLEMCDNGVHYESMCRGLLRCACCKILYNTGFLVKIIKDILTFLF